MADFCDKCGAMLAEGIKYCTSCGEAVEQDTPVVTTEENAAENTSANVSTEEVSVATENAGLEHIKAEETEVIAPEPVYSGSSSSDEETSYSSNASDNDAYSSVNSNAPVKNKPGFAIASMVCGIVSILCCCTGYFGLLLSIVAVVLGIVALVKKYDGKGMAIAGIICGSIGLIIVLILIAMGAAMTTALSSEEIINQLENGTFDFDQYL